MKALFIAVLGATISIAPAISFATQADSPAGPDRASQRNENADAYSLLRQSISQIDSQVPVWPKNLTSLDRSGYGFSYGGSWESAAPKLAPSYNNPLYAHH